ENPGMGNRISRTKKRVISVLGSGADRFVGNDGDRCRGVAFWFSWNSAHVAVLARNACRSGGRCPVLGPDDFQIDARIDGHLVARGAEVAGTYLFERNDGLVDRLPRPRLLRARLHLVVVLLRKHLAQVAARSSARNRFKNRTGFDAALAVDQPIPLADAVAGNA